MSTFRLPDLLVFGGDWQSYIETLYECYTGAFVRTHPPVGPARRWAVKRHPMADGKDATFWHLISSGEVEDDRTPDLRRCERLPWARYLIDSAMTGSIDQHMYCWEQMRYGERRILLAPRGFEYVVVLADRKQYVMLWTAYCVEQPHRQRKLQNDWMASRLAAPW